MKAYQAGISKFTDSNSVVFGVSTDDLETNKKFAESLNLDFPLLSDASGDASKKFGIYNAERNMSNLLEAARVRQTNRWPSPTCYNL